MEVRSIEFLREIECSDADSKACRAACGWAATTIVRLRGVVKEAHREGCCDGLEMCCHSDTWDESEAKRAITIPENQS